MESEHGLGPVPSRLRHAEAPAAGGSHDPAEVNPAAPWPQWALNCRKIRGKPRLVSAQPGSRAGGGNRVSPG